MTRIIDEDKPLSDEDRQFLMQNGQENRVRNHDDRLGVTPPSYPYMTGAEPSLATGVPANGLANAPGVSPQMVSVALGDPAMLLGSLTEEQLQAELDRRSGVDSGSGGGPADGSPAASQVVRETDDGVPDYEDWKAATLRAQLGVRELNKSGNKDDLVERLRDDDGDAETGE